MKKDKILFTVKDICEIAMLCAIAIVLSVFCEIKVGANGGSIGFGMIPLFLICYRHGFIKGFIATGIIYALICCAIDGYGFACFPFDYLLAYGSLSVVSFFYKPIFESESKWKPYVFIALSILLACFLRFVFHVISGMILWSTPFVGSITYNIAYVGPSCAICIVVFCALYIPFKRINNMFPTKRYPFFLVKKKEVEQDNSTSEE